MKNRVLNLFRDRQFLLYALIGLSGVAIDIVAYIFFTTALSITPLIANFIAISLGIINNFFLNRRFNFKITDNTLVRFFLFYSVGVIGIGLSEILLLSFHYILDLGSLTSKLLTLLPVLLFQFLLNKRVSFGEVTNFKRAAKKIVLLWTGILLFVVLLVALTSATNHMSSSPQSNLLYDVLGSGTYFIYNAA